MSEENVALVRGAYEAWNSGDLEWLYDHMADNFEFRPQQGYPDVPEVYQGKQGFADFAEEWQSAWEEITIVVERVTDHGDRVVSLLTHRGRGRSSGIFVTEEVGHIVTIQEGMLTELIALDGWRQTLEAAGLEG